MGNIRGERSKGIRPTLLEKYSKFSRYNMKYSGYYMKYSVLYHFFPATFHAILRKIDFLWDSVWQGWCKDWSTCCLDGRIDVPGSQPADNPIALASHGSIVER